MAEADSSRGFSVPRFNKRCRDLTGMLFNRLLALSFAGRDRAGNILWNCECKCGNNAVVRAVDLTRNRTKSCGCLETESRITHGLHDTPEYQAWASMISRCQNPNTTGYAYYGGRGIVVCERWATSFENFYADMGQRPSSSHSIDRENNDGNYEPGNCRWATARQQVLNRRKYRRSDCPFVEYNGAKISIADLARQAGMSYSVLYGRIHLGWSVERSVSEPVHKNLRSNAS